MLGRKRPDRDAVDVSTTGNFCSIQRQEPRGEQAVPSPIPAQTASPFYSHRSCALNGTAEDGVGSQPRVAQIRSCAGAKEPPEGHGSRHSPASALLPESPRFKKTGENKGKSRDFFQFVFPGTALQANTPVFPGKGAAEMKMSVRRRVLPHPGEGSAPRQPGSRYRASVPRPPQPG